MTKIFAYLYNFIYLKMVPAHKHGAGVLKFLESIKRISPSIQRLIRYVKGGIAINLLAYSLYLLLTFQWLEPKYAMSVLYPFGMLLAYFTHSKYSFEQSTYRGKALFKFTIAHFFCYLINITLLYMLVDIFLLPHQLVALLCIPIVSGLFFVLIKFFVFTPEERS